MVLGHTKQATYDYRSTIRCVFGIDISSTITKQWVSESSVITEGGGGGGADSDPLPFLYGLNILVVYTF